MNTCKTCKAWKPYTGERRDVDPAQAAGGYCGSEKINEDWGQGYDPDSLRYSYSESGGFWTGPEFGCVHHAPKS